MLLVTNVALVFHDHFIHIYSYLEAFLYFLSVVYTNFLILNFYT